MAARLRLSMMCPSRIDLAASEMGSEASSPSTRTVYSPVIAPLELVPARSISFGRAAKTLGV